MKITQTKFDIGIGYVDPKKKSDFYFPLFFVQSHQGKVVIIGHKNESPIPCLIYKDKYGEFILVNNEKTKIHSKHKKFCI